MMTLKEYKKTLRYAVGYSASLATLKRIARTSKVKHVPARSKLRIAKRARSQDKSLTFANRYGESGRVSGANIMHAELSKLEMRVIAGMPRESLNYLVQISS